LQKSTIPAADARDPAPDAYQTWLNGRPAQARDLLHSYPPERMLTHAVGPHVNFLEYDDPSLIRPIV